MKNMKKVMKKSLMDLPTPNSISFLWNMGFLLGMTLSVQIITGVMLSMNYIPTTGMAFESVTHMMRDMSSGWVMRYTHMNMASLFFLLMYIHIARGIYFESFSKLPLVWSSGVMMLLLSMMTAFMGYILPWGQMSYWGATVITSMMSSIPYIGNTLIMWLWGDFSVSQPTLNRMLSLHFLSPLLLSVLVLVHLMLLHTTGSSNPHGLTTNQEKLTFFPVFMVKDLTPGIIISLMMAYLISLKPDILGDPENFNPASTTTTPTHIKPEWYFLFAYAILRSIPSKLGGVLAMAASILILMVLVMKKSKINKKFNPPKKLIFWAFIMVMMLLTWLGGKPVNDITSMVSQLTSTTYFSLTLML